MIRVLRHRLPRFCMGRRGTARVRTRSPPQQQQQQQQYKRSYSSIKTDEELISTTSEFSSKNSTEMNYKLQDNNSSGNRVMIVVDSSLEAKGALHWALSHTVQSQLDTIILMHVLVTNNSSTQGGNSSREVNQRAYELLSSTKNICQMKRPGVQVEILVKEGQEKGATIVEEAKQEKVSLLVLGQPKRSIMWRLRNMWAGKRKRRRGCSAVDYCVQNANCMTIAVRRKSSKHGGYLITTKRHKDFWLLA